MTTFNTPFMVGFNELEDMLVRMAKGTDSFPPYNIEQLDDETLRISLAVAGYTDSDLDITREDNRLIIRGHQEQDPTRQYLYRGIAGRSFIKSFILADGIKLMGAGLADGLLSIDLRKPKKQLRVQKIAIKTKSKPVLLTAERGKK